MAITRLVNWKNNSNAAPTKKEVRICSECNRPNTEGGRDAMHRACKSKRDKKRRDDIFKYEVKFI